MNKRGVRRGVALRVAVILALTSTWTISFVGAAAAQTSAYEGCGVLAEGSAEAACVRQVQGDINTINGNDLLPVTGVFGPKTRDAVVAFQKQQGLPPTGNAGELTQAELTRQTAEPATSDTVQDPREIGRPGEAPTAPESWDPDPDPNGPGGTNTQFEGTDGGTGRCTIPDDLSTIQCNVSDENPDKHSVYVKWEQGDSKGNISNTLGSGTTVAGYGRTNQADRDKPLRWRFCTDIQLRLDDCSDEVVRERSPGAPATIPAERCKGDVPFASLRDYLTGKVDAPKCFPYDPEVEETAAGVRALDPYADGCSGPTLDDAGPYWDRRDACGTHDYAYDLLRYGVDTFDEPAADGFLLKDMLADCNSRAQAPACIDHAYRWRAGVRFGTVAPGDEIAYE